MVSYGMVQTCPMLMGFNASSQGAEITVSHVHHSLLLKHPNTAVVY